MLEIGLIGLNHTTASVALRECLAFSADETTEGLKRLREVPSLREVVLISTCNRVEVLFTAPDGEVAAADVKRFLADFKQAPAADFEQALYFFRGDEAVRHVFRVAASLDSMVVGEPQILGQIKSAYQAATSQKLSGVILNRLLHRTFFVAKRVRTETGIGDHAVSISYAAIELARKIFGSLDGRRALLIGAGEMAELAVEHLIRQRIDSVQVANRTFSRGLALATRFRGQALRFEEIPVALGDVDIVISSTGSTNYVLRRDTVKGLMRRRRNRPLFFVDIAVPRDIDPDINRLHNCYVYDVDDLKGVVEDNIDDRQQEAVKGERIVDEAVLRFRQWYDNLDVVPTIVSLRQKINAIVDAEVARTLNSLPEISDDARKAISRMTEAMVNKVLHNPTTFLKGDGCHSDRSLYLDAVRKLFDLDGPNSPGDPD